MISVLKFALKFPPLRFVLSATRGIMPFAYIALEKEKEKKQQNAGVIELKNYNIFIFDISAEIQIYLEVSPTLFCVKCHKRHKGILPTLLRKKKKKKKNKTKHWCNRIKELQYIYSSSPFYFLLQL